MKLSCRLMLGVVLCTAHPIYLSGCGDSQSSTDQSTSTSTSDTGSTTDDPQDGDGSTGMGVIPETLEVFGTVVDDEREPVAEAMVMQGGREESLILTGEDGSFSIVLENPGYGLSVLVAAKEGYRAAGMEFFIPGESVMLVLRAIKEPDNLDYVYQDPGDGRNVEKEDCTHCHGTFVSQLLASKHAEAARDPEVQDLYAGVSRAHADEFSCLAAGGAWELGLEPGTESTEVFKCYLGGGVLGDLNESCGGAEQPVCDVPNVEESAAPSAFGGCADCHAPGIDGVAGGRNLHEATGLAYEKGVHCDVCHKVRDVDLSKPPGVGQRLVMGRPNEPGQDVFEWAPVYYGPLIDVPNYIMGGSYQPKFNTAVFCAGCHEQDQPALIPNETLDESRWPNGLPVHSTYSEWLDGPYNQESTPCQFCHMPATINPVDNAVNAVDISTMENQGITFGFPREPNDIRQHIFRGPLAGNPRLIDQALYVSLIVSESDGVMDVSASVANVGCGHAVPTGEPMRSVVMVVHAEAEGCGELKAIGGLTVPDTGGALARGVLGVDLTAIGTTIEWLSGSEKAEVGHVLRVVRPTGNFDDYKGVGVFGDSERSAEDKGMEVFEPVGEAVIQSVGPGRLSVDKSLDVQAGDVVYLGNAWTTDFVDGADSLYLAGMSGNAFSRVLLDSSGQRHVPHYKAVDMASDNRIPAGGRNISNHRFSLPAGCGPGQVRAQVLYRPVPLDQGTMRGWETKDYLIAEGARSFP